MLTKWIIGAAAMFLSFYALFKTRYGFLLLDKIGDEISGVLLGLLAIYPVAFILAPSDFSFTIDRWFPKAGPYITGMAIGLLLAIFWLRAEVERLNSEEIKKTSADSEKQ